MSAFFQSLLDDPTSFHNAVYSDGFKLSREQIDEVQLSGVRKRFAEMRPQIPMLDKLAKEQGVDSIDTINDVIPILFPHTVYKSYPLSYLEKSRFEKLTRWLNGLTTVDLSNVDASGIELIDDWLDLLDKETPLLVSHTSGTTGKLSFIPRTKEQWRQTVVHSGCMLRHWWGENSGPDLFNNHRPLILPGYRYGGSATQRANDYMIELFAGSEDNALFMYPNARFSADVVSLAGRLRSAEARGEQGMLEISPALLKRREGLLELEKTRAQDLQTFFDTARTKFGGKDVYIAGVWTMLYDWAEAGLADGHSGIFGKGSVLFSGGGMKGKALPDNYREVIKGFLGFDTTYEMYAISEQMGYSIKCEEGHYHIPPVIVPFLLDPATGEALPRKDGTTGRMALLDLMTQTYWSCLITGDEVTWGGFDKPCACGRTGTYVHDGIRRYSDKEGGDDKIVCAGAPEAHDQALAFLTELSQ
ncbi:MAG: hypothetical protein VR73_05735 [Gammaproteobacteria bacterium BRH_c0]|nr:MAG: hypothetical protein VR73_05735 [Gammaproteobacteria bacterium BRH_c0]